jgi:hypothetical protein
MIQVSRGGGNQRNIEEGVVTTLARAFNAVANAHRLLVSESL